MLLDVTSMWQCVDVWTPLQQQTLHSLDSKIIMIIIKIVGTYGKKKVEDSVTLLLSSAPTLEARNGILTDCLEQYTLAIMLYHAAVTQEMCAPVFCRFNTVHVTARVIERLGRDAQISNRNCGSVYVSMGKVGNSQNAARNGCFALN